MIPPLHIITPRKWPLGPYRRHDHVRPSHTPHAAYKEATDISVRVLVVISAKVKTSIPFSLTKGALFNADVWVFLKKAEVGTGTRACDLDCCSLRQRHSFTSQHNRAYFNAVQTGRRGSICHALVRFLGSLRTLHCAMSDRCRVAARGG